MSFFKMLIINTRRGSRNWGQELGAISWPINKNAVQICLIPLLSVFLALEFDPAKNERTALCVNSITICHQKFMLWVLRTNSKVESCSRQLLDLFINLEIQLCRAYHARIHLTKYIPIQTMIARDPIIIICMHYP